MKTSLILFLVVASHAAKTTRNKQKTEYDRSEKREDNGIEKRAPLLPTVSPSVSPGVEYAQGTDKNILQEKSPTQQIYATPVPQFAKISDVLAQGPPFQAAIANQLYSPVSVYQPRFPTYEVSQPIPSHLAYSEHTPQSIPRNYYQQYQDNQLGFQEQYQQPTYQLQKSEPVQVQSQQAYSPHQQGAISYASFAQNQIEQQQAGNQQPAQYQPLQLVKYQLQHQAPQVQPQEYQPAQQPQYTQPQPQIIQQQPQIVQQPKLIQQQPQLIQQQPQLLQQPQLIQQQPHLQQQLQYQPQYEQYQPQLQQYVQPQYSQPQYQIQQYEQPQYQQYVPKAQVQLQPLTIKQKNAKQQYFKQLAQPVQAKATQQPAYNQAQDVGYSGQVALPTFPPVQYFGKFAQNVFGQYQH